MVDVVVVVHVHPRFVGNKRNDARPLQFVPMRIGAFDDEAGDGAVGVKRMYCRHPIAGVGHECPQLLDRPPEVPGPERDSSMIDVR